MTNKQTQPSEFSKVLKNIVMFFVKLPFTILFGGLKATSQSFYIMHADKRIKQQEKRGVITVDSSGRYVTGVR